MILISSKEFPPQNLSLHESSHRCAEARQGEARENGHGGPLDIWGNSEGGCCHSCNSWFGKLSMVSLNDNNVEEEHEDSSPGEGEEFVPSPLFPLID